jgi:lipopolysaccharide export system protein LptA
VLKKRCTIFSLRRLLTAIVLAAAAVLIPASVFSAGAASSAGVEKASNEQPIQITAEQLISDNEKKFAEFIGSVRAVQGNFVITSDKLRIYYEGELLQSDRGKDSDREKGKNRLLQKIIASGHVKINSDQYRAEAEEAVYDTQSMTIVLSGANSTVISGKNSITGSKITLYRQQGRIKVEGSAKNRIKAIFYSKGESLDAIKLEKSDQ